MGISGFSVFGIDTLSYHLGARESGSSCVENSLKCHKANSGKSFQEAETEEYFHDCLLEEHSLDAAAATLGEKEWNVHLQAKGCPNSTVIYMNGSKLAFCR